MELNILTNLYNVKKLSDGDCDDILKLYNSNPQYFEYCPPKPSIDTVKDDLSALPNNVAKQDKHFLGFYDGNELIGIIDLTKTLQEFSCPL